MEEKSEDEMKIIEHEVVVDGGGSADAQVMVNDPLQKFVDNITKEHDQKIPALNKIQFDLLKAIDNLTAMSSKDHDTIEKMINLLKDLGKMTGVADNNSIGDEDEGFDVVRKYISNITSNVKKVMQKCKDVDHELKDNKDMVAALKEEVAEKDKQLKQYKMEAEKIAMIQKLKRMNEEKVMTRKELEDLEDSLAKEMKTLHMRKVFVQSIHAKIKPPIPEDDKQREVIEKSLSTSMEKMKSLKEEIGKIQKIVQQNNTRH